MNYEIAKQIKARLEENHNAATARLKEVSGDERGPLGLTPDHVKARPEWRTAYNTERFAFGQLREFNGYMTKAFANEMRAERRKARA